MKQTALLLLLSISLNLLADPPEPPLGKRWVLNEKFSDEFNGMALDTTKWYDHHPTWKGRPPGIFLPSQVEVANGYMSIRGEKLPRDTVIRRDTFNIAGGAVVSRSTDAGFGYYECRFKAAATLMSTTFWFSSRRNFEGPEGCGDSYGLEWDVQECIGREGDFNGKYFAKGMHSNSHFWYRNCEGERFDHRAPQVLFEDEKLASADFNTYGGWWKNEREATYYYNNGEGKSHVFYTEIMDKPFNQTMGMNLVSETYPFPWISLPTDEELADREKSICYYDWVRAYLLVDVDQAFQGADDPLKIHDRPMFEERVYFPEDFNCQVEEELLGFVLCFESKIGGPITVELSDEKGRVLSRGTFPVRGGYGKKSLHLGLDKKLKKNVSYSLKASMADGASMDEYSFDL